MVQALINEKIKVIDDGEARLAEVLKALDEGLLDNLLDLLRKLDQEGGNFTATNRNIELLTTFARAVRQVMTGPEYVDTVNDYLAKFDRVVELSYDIVRELSGKKVPISSVVNQAMKELVADLKDALTNYKNIDRAVRMPIQQQLYRHVILGSSFRETETALRTFFKSDPGEYGHMARWANQLTRDALNGLDGMVNYNIAKETELDGFRFVGSLIDTSRKTCRHMVMSPAPVVSIVKKETVTEQNIFADLSMGPGMYRIADIPIIIERSQNLPGWNPNTTAATYFQNRNGYGCRHQVIPFLLAAAKQRKIIEQLN
jgi:hypothetical protein